MNWYDFCVWQYWICLENFKGSRNCNLLLHVMGITPWGFISTEMNHNLCLIEGGVELELVFILFGLFIVAILYSSVGFWKRTPASRPKTVGFRSRSQSPEQRRIHPIDACRETWKNRNSQNTALLRSRYWNPGFWPKKCLWSGSWIWKKSVAAFTSSIKGGDDKDSFQILLILGFGVILFFHYFPDHEWFNLVLITFFSFKETGKDEKMNRWKNQCEHWY